MADLPKKIVELTGPPHVAEIKPLTQEQRLNQAIAKMARRNIGMQEDLGVATAESLFKAGQVSLEEMKAIQDGIATEGENLAKGLPAAAIGSVGDVTSMAVALGANAYNMLRGQRFAWPEDFNDVPATSDFWGDRFGADTGSLAFIGGTLAVIDPSDAKFVSKALKMAKALGGSKKAALANRNKAEKLLDEGTNPDEVWKETGWWQGKDGKLRFAISDAAAVVVDEGWQKQAALEARENLWDIGEVRNITVRSDELLQHDALFELYPEVAGYPMTVPVQRLEDGSFDLANQDRIEAWFRASKKTGGEFGFPGTGDFRGSILHEVQHAVQSLEDFQSGFGSKVLEEAVDSYRVNSLLLNAADNPDIYTKLSDAELMKAIKKATPRSDEETWALLQRQVRSYALHGVDDMERIVMIGARNLHAKRATRYLNQVGMEGHIRELVDDLDPDTLKSLSTARYLQDLGEAEARLIQAMADISQEKIDRFVKDPHSLMSYLEPDTIKRVDPKGEAGFRAMEDAVSVEHTIVD